MNKKLCTSCGACCYLSKGKISMERTSKTYAPKIKKNVSSINQEDMEKIKKACPAKGYDILSTAKKLFENEEKYDYRIGYYQVFYALKSNNEKTLTKASSGGIMTEIAIYLLNEGIVNGVIATTFEYKDNIIIPKTIIAKTPEELYKCQGSKYMPIPSLSILSEVQKFEGKLAYVGTPCQIAALRKIQEIDTTIKEKIEYVIGNFCGGYRDLREQASLIKISKINPVNHFQYRGDGQPGYMVIANEKKQWKYPYPDYAKLTGYLKKYRCRVCIDATAELADLSCGDAWLPELKNRRWSISIIRNKTLVPILTEMIEKGIISRKDITLENILASQKGNLTSKKERFLSRRKLFSLFAFPFPTYDGGWSNKNTYSIIFEAKVYLSEILKFLLFKLNLLTIIRKDVKQQNHNTLS